MGQLEEIIKYNRPRNEEGTIIGVDTEGIRTKIGYDKYGNINSIKNPVGFQKYIRVKTG